MCSDGAQVLLSIQNEREWGRLCSDVLGQSAIATDPRFNTPSNRVAHRDELDAIISTFTADHTRDVMVASMLAAKIACAAVNDLSDVVAHPQLRTITYSTPGGLAEVVAPPVYSVSAEQPPVYAAQVLNRIWAFHSRLLHDHMIAGVKAECV